MLSTETLLSQFALLLMLIAANFVLTVAMALGRKAFDWMEFPKWLVDHCLKLVIPWAFIAGVSYLADRYGGVSGWQETGLVVVAGIAYATVVATLIKKALGTWSDLGVQPPPTP